MWFLATMLRMILMLVCAAIVTTYPTDNPISEPPNIVLASPDEMVNRLPTLDLSEAVSPDEEDCESPDASQLPEKRSEDQDPPPIRRPACSSRNFLRLGRGNLDQLSDLEPDEGKSSNYFRLDRGGKSNDNFIRFGRGENNANFIRFGKAGKQNFLRFGRDKSDNFIRFGRGKSGNFVRFGRAKPDNFIRFGRGKSNNFLRFGRKPENFIRFGRDKANNFVRFGRGPKDNFVRFGRNEMSSFVDPADQPDDDVSNNNNMRVGRGGKSDSNFIRFGRAGGSNFIRFGRANDEIFERDEKGKSSGSFVRFGRSSGNSNDLRRGKLTDRNFIRLGRSEQPSVQYDDSDNDELNDDTSVRLGRSDFPGGSRNFIRLGKRSEQDQAGDLNRLLRFGRDVEKIDEMPILSEDSNETDNKSSKEMYQHPRARRSAPFSEDDVTEDSSEYSGIISNNAYDDTDRDSTTYGEPQTPFRYYSPLTSGIPNYILSPELSVLTPLSNTVDSPESKRGKVAHNRNYIRLG